MTGFDQATIDFYAAEAPVYLSSRPDGVARHLPAFLDHLKPGASILELGCGGGRDAEYMIARGFCVDPTDGTAAIARQAELRLNSSVRVMRFEELVEASAYDAVVATASLLHVPRADLPEILGRVYRALVPGGWHLATYKAGGAEGRDDHGRYYNYPSKTELSGYYGQAGEWALQEIEEYVGGGFFGGRGPWLRITAQKAVDAD